MGDIIGSIFGTSSTQSQQTTPDVVQQALNQERLNQLINFFQTQGPIYQFGGPREDIYRPTAFTTDLASIARNDMLSPRNNPDLNPIPYSFYDYQRAFDPVAGTYNNAMRGIYDITAQGQAENLANYNLARGNISGDVNRALQRSYSDFNTGAQGAANAAGWTTSIIDQAYNAAIARGDYDLARSLTTNEGYANRSLGMNADIANQNLAMLNESAQKGYDVNKYNYLRSLGIVDADTLRSLITQGANRQQALDLGIGATDNYISQIATPRINQALTLQGLEYGGALPAAIARATAETAMPYLQSIESAYGSNVANTLNSAMTTKAGLGSQLTGLDADLVQAWLAARAQLGGQYAGLQSGVNTQLAAQQGAATEAAAAGNRQLGGQLMAGRAQAGNTYANNISQLAQALMANNISLEQAGISAESALGQQLVQVQNALRLQQQQGVTSLASSYIPQQSNFVQSLPGAAQAFTLLPQQLQTMRTANLTALQPLADYPRLLQEQDLARRQGLFTSLYTGIPFQPGTSTLAGSATGNIFDQLGGTISSGLTGGQGTPGGPWKG